MANSNHNRTSGTTQCVAVELGVSQVHAVEIDKSGGEVRIIHRGSGNLPPNAWANVPGNIEGIALAIREALSSAGVSSKAVVASLPRRLVTVRFARLPHAAPDQMRGMVEFEAQQHIPFPVNEVCLDYHVLTGLGANLGIGGDDMQLTLLAAARKTLVADIVSCFDRAGVELKQLTVSSLALAELIRDAIEPTAVVSLNPGSLDVAVVASGQLLFTRASSIDLAASPQRFGEEVVRSFTAYKNENRQRPLSHIYLVGHGANRGEMESIEATLTEMLEIPVSRLQNRTLSSADPTVRTYATAVGTGLQALDGQMAGVNLVPRDRAERRAKQQSTIRNYLIAAATGAALIAGGVYLQGFLADREKRDRQTIVANSELKTAKEREKRTKADYDRISGLESVLAASMDRIHPSVDVLVALHRAMPSSSQIWLTQLSFDRATLLTIRGEAKDAESVTELLMNLQKAGCFTDVKLGYLGDAVDSDSGDFTAASNTPNDADDASNTTSNVPALPGMQPNSSGQPPATNNGAMPQGGTRGGSSNQPNSGSNSPIIIQPNNPTFNPGNQPTPGTPTFVPGGGNSLPTLPPGNIIVPSGISPQETNLRIEDATRVLDEQRKRDAIRADEERKGIRLDNTNKEQPQASEGRSGSRLRLAGFQPPTGGVPNAPTPEGQVPNVPNAPTPEGGEAGGRRGRGNRQSNMTPEQLEAFRAEWTRRSQEGGANPAGGSRRGGGFRGGQGGSTSNLNTPSPNPTPAAPPTVTSQPRSTQPRTVAATNPVAKTTVKKTVKAVKKEKTITAFVITCKLKPGAVLVKDVMPVNNTRLDTNGSNEPDMTRKPNEEADIPDDEGVLDE